MSLLWWSFIAILIFGGDDIDQLSPGKLSQANVFRGSYDTIAIALDTATDNATFMAFDA